MNITMCACGRTFNLNRYSDSSAMGIHFEGLRSAR
jgi:hypothetical protein